MLHFIKLGGSLITDKNRPLTPRPLVIQRLAEEIAAAWRAQPQQRWLLSHGSGSYGHALGRRFRTREGVHDAAGWQGFAATAHVAAQLNRLVMAALLRAGVPALSLSPAALVQCHDGSITQVNPGPVLAALAAGLAPVVHGDVAFDSVRGGTIVSTEQVLAALAPHLPPDRLTLVGIVDGVFDSDPIQHAGAQRLPRLRLSELATWAGAFGGSHGIDVTGGMAAKIETVAALLQEHPRLRIHLLSGEIPGHLLHHLLDPDAGLGTTLTA